MHVKRKKHSQHYKHTEPKTQHIVFTHNSAAYVHSSHKEKYTIYLNCADHIYYKYKTVAFKSFIWLKKVGSLNYSVYVLYITYLYVHLRAQFVFLARFAQCVQMDSQICFSRTRTGILLSHTHKTAVHILFYYCL